MKMKETIDVVIKIKAEVSFWDALKLRLAGADEVRKHIDRILKKSEERIRITEEVTTDIKE